MEKYIETIYDSVSTYSEIKYPLETKEMILAIRSYKICTKEAYYCLNICNDKTHDTYWERCSVWIYMCYTYISCLKKENKKSRKWVINFQQIMGYGEYSISEKK